MINALIVHLPSVVAERGSTGFVRPTDSGPKAERPIDGTRSTGTATSAPYYDATSVSMKVQIDFCLAIAGSSESRSLDMALVVRVRNSACESLLWPLGRLQIAG